MKGIKILNDVNMDMFKRGKIVFIIKDENLKEVGVAFTNGDYENLLSSHKYNPLLYLSPFEIKLAYLFGCLNSKYGDEPKKFFFYFRELFSENWIEWFEVLGSKDEFY